MYSRFNCTWRDDISHSDTEQRDTMVAYIVQGLHRPLMSLLDNHHIAGLTYLPCCKGLNQGKMPIDTRFSILDNKKTLQPYRTVNRSQLKAAIRTLPHPEQRWISSWWLMLSPPCGPSTTNNMNCLVVALKRCHHNRCCIAQNVLYIGMKTETLLVLDVVCEVGTSLESSISVTLELPLSHCTPPSQVI